jgi:SpoVK/Ycf46/Vps4 family AAA+-type ATPase
LIKNPFALSLSKCECGSTSSPRTASFYCALAIATNQRGNIDEAFVRRFQSIIYFPMPRAEERHQIWRNAFPPQITIADDIDWQQIAARFELTGAGIMSVTHYCAVELLANKTLTLHFKHLEAAILREYIKEGKVI